MSVFCAILHVFVVAHRYMHLQVLVCVRSCVKGVPVFSFVFHILSPGLSSPVCFCLRQ